MSCDRRCFDPESKWHDHDDCSTCPGADVFRPMAKDYQTFEKTVCLIENSKETPAGGGKTHFNIYADEQSARAAWNAAIEQAAKVVREKYDEEEPWVSPEDIESLRCGDGG